MNKRIISCILAMTVSLIMAGVAVAAPPTQWCKDIDGDGYGDAADCEGEYEDGLVENGGDCNDGDHGKFMLILNR